MKSSVLMKKAICLAVQVFLEEIFFATLNTRESNGLAGGTVGVYGNAKRICLTGVVHLVFKYYPLQVVRSEYRYSAKGWSREKARNFILGCIVLRDASRGGIAPRTVYLRHDHWNGL